MGLKLPLDIDLKSTVDLDLTGNFLPRGDWVGETPDGAV